MQEDIRKLRESMETPGEGNVKRDHGVARIAGMPVATLRIWEQRYQAVRPITAASGHRLYSSADVERATLLRRLTTKGHAIGLLASLETDQMREMLHAPEVTMPANQPVVAKHLAMRVVEPSATLDRSSTIEAGTSDGGCI